jgi:hypothetical protein
MPDSEVSDVRSSIALCPLRRATRAYHARCERTAGRQRVRLQRVLRGRNCASVYRCARGPAGAVGEVAGPLTATSKEVGPGASCVHSRVPFPCRGNAIVARPRQSLMMPAACNFPVNGAERAGIICRREHGVYRTKPVYKIRSARPPTTLPIKSIPITSSKSIAGLVLHSVAANGVIVVAPCTQFTKPIAR